MYFSQDFRFLINSGHEDQAIRSISREPFTEILHYWDEMGRPSDKLSIYQKGLQRAIARDRYPIFLLSQIESFPEFYEAALNGCIELWLTLRFSLLTSNMCTRKDISINQYQYEEKDEEGTFDISKYRPNKIFDKDGYSLMVDSNKGRTLDFSSEEKQYILQYIFHKRSIPLIIDNQPIQTGIFLSRKAEQLYTKVTWLNLLIVHTNDM